MAKTSAKMSNAKTGKADAIPRLPVNKLLSIDALIPVEAKTIEVRKINKIAAMIWLPKFLSEDEQNARIIRAIELYESLEPTDGAESMLVAQMVGVHSAALDCMRRVAIDGQTFEGRDQNLKHATKLMTLYAKQLETLSRRRGEGRQKITVEHVYVAAGGQAIVGNVDARSRAGGASQKIAALDVPRELPLDLSLDAEPLKPKIRK